MNIKNIIRMASVTIKKHAPEICIAAGTAGMLTGATIACVKTYKKAHKITEQHEAEVDCVKNEELEEKEESRELTKVCVHTAFKFVKLYSIPFAIELASGTLILLGTGMFKKRLASTSLLAASLGSTLLNYREKVADKIGAEEEEKLYFGIQEEENVEKIVDENGKTKKLKSTKNTDAVPADKFVIKIDRDWALWNENRELVVHKIMMMRNAAQTVFETYGWYSFNQLCRHLGLPEKECPEGQIITWIYDKELPEDQNQILFLDFDKQKELFLSGKQDYILLNPNFDGPYINMIPDAVKKFEHEMF